VWRSMMMMGGAGYCVIVQPSLLSEVGLVVDMTVPVFIVLIIRRFWKSGPWLLAAGWLSCDEEQECRESDEYSVVEG
jgi:hypothetical protein